MSEPSGNSGKLPTPEPSTTAEDLAEEYRKTLRDFLGGSHGAHMLNAGKQGYLAGYRASEADMTPLDERCFRAGVKEGRRLEREGRKRTMAEIATGSYERQMAEKDTTITQLRQSLAEKDAEISRWKNIAGEYEMREDLFRKEITHLQEKLADSERKAAEEFARGRLHECQEQLWKHTEADSPAAVYWAEKVSDIQALIVTRASPSPAEEAGLVEEKV